MSAKKAKLAGRLARLTAPAYGPEGVAQDGSRRASAYRRLKRLYMGLPIGEIRKRLNAAPRSR